MKIKIIAAASAAVLCLGSTAGAKVSSSFIVHDTSEAIYYEVGSDIVYGAVRPLLIEAEDGKKDAYVPLRDLCERLGYTVDWDDKNKTVLMEKEDEAFSAYYPIGSDYVFVNGEQAKLKKKLLLEDGVTYFYFRDYMRIFGLSSLGSNYTTGDTLMSSLAGQVYEEGDPDIQEEQGHTP